MKKLYLALLAAGVALISSCSYNGAATTPPGATDSTLVTFKTQFTANFDEFVVDTAHGNSGMGDTVLSDNRISVQDIVVDTGLTYKGYSHVAKVVTMQGSLAIDSDFYYQDPSGDLYRYNFGFKILNSYAVLVAAIGAPVDQGWILAARMKSASGTTWIAKQEDSIAVTFINGLYVHFSSSAQMLADTTIIVGTQSLKCRHARHHVIASVPQGQYGHEAGDAYVDTYVCPALGAVPIDFYHHVVLAGSLTTSQAQGKFKLMTSHN